MEVSLLKSFPTRIVACGAADSGGCRYRPYYSTQAEVANLSINTSLMLIYLVAGDNIDFQIYC